MAIKRQTKNPVVILDAVVVGIEEDSRADETTGELIRKGRKLTVQTSQGPDLEVKARPEFDLIEFSPGQRLTMNCEYSEYDFLDGLGRKVAGSILQFHSFVSADQIDLWHSAVKLRSNDKADSK